MNSISFPAKQQGCWAPGTLENTTEFRAKRSLLDFLAKAEGTRGITVLVMNSEAGDMRDRLIRFILDPVARSRETESLHLMA